MSRTYKELFIYYLLSEENFSEFFSKEICYDLKSMKISIKESKEKTKKIGMKTILCNFKNKKLNYDGKVITSFKELVDIL